MLDYQMEWQVCLNLMLHGATRDDAKACLSHCTYLLSHVVIGFKQILQHEYHAVSDASWSSLEANPCEIYAEVYSNTQQYKLRSRGIS
jgi:hypothetical protein